MCPKPVPTIGPYKRHLVSGGQSLTLKGQQIWNPNRRGWSLILRRAEKQRKGCAAGCCTPYGHSHETRHELQESTVGNCHVAGQSGSKACGCLLLQPVLGMSPMWRHTNVQSLFCHCNLLYIGLSSLEQSYDWCCQVGEIRHVLTKSVPQSAVLGIPQTKKAWPFVECRHGQYCVFFKTSPLPHTCFSFHLNRARASKKETW